ncbi:TetR/AcrR family transcriptional regulator [Mycetocola tolaasinivorans]|uniref:TetR/AcrR family transcriptional regulator n=1 Tax=Mycetocola tolaasinivorans TaxID=76635 RepID=A0A3L7A4U7_9MICO|nr:TetR/AcrR family transcriptional regulator [Mycetocola tolaasinivorans]RLP74322.1 TetR/AcrR family transcriptional regulator [Mycetocola tolaasinivorans]
MRPSNREKILSAAYGVVEREGVSAVTFEAVSAASGISRGGLLYHFRSKEELLLALHEYLAQRWEERLIEALGRAPEEATADEKIAAYARVSARSASGPELLLILESSIHSELRRPWSAVLAEWTPNLAGVSPEDPVALDRLLAVLAANGLWASEAISDVRIPAELRGALAERISGMLESPSAP